MLKASAVAGNVIDSSLSSLSSTSHGQGSRWGVVQARGVQAGGPGRGVQAWGEGTFHPPCHILHYHMVLALKGLRTTMVNCVFERFVFADSGYAVVTEDGDAIDVPMAAAPGYLPMDMNTASLRSVW